MRLPDQHPKLPSQKVGILLVNLGTPDSTKWWDIRKYLKEFLSDRRVIEVNPIIWQIILNLIILTFRPSKTAEAYKEIWMEDIDMSPLRFYTIEQKKKTSRKIQEEKKYRSRIRNEVRQTRNKNQTARYENKRMPRDRYFTPISTICSRNNCNSM